MIVPTVGMGATYSVGSDRYAFTVIRILSPTRIVLQQDNYKRTDNNGLSESQEYEYTPNPDGRVVTVSLRKGDKWVEVGMPKQSSGYWLGKRRTYLDPSF